MTTNDMTTSTNSKHNVSTASGRSFKMQDDLAKEYFWGCKLDQENQFCTWTHKVEDDKTDSDYMQHNLFLRHAVLGVEATEERNIVTIETKDYHSNEIVQPLLSLQRGVADMCQLDINFSKDQDMTLRLAEGKGPVYISAQHLVEFPREVSTDDEITENEEDAMKDDIIEDLQVKQEDGIIEEVRRKTIKRKASAAKAKSKREKLDVLCDEDEEDEEEDAEMSYDEVDEDDEDDEEDEEEEEEEEDEEEEESEDEVMTSPRTKYLGTKKVKSSQLTINGKKKKAKVAVKESKKPKIVLKVPDVKQSSGKKVKKLKK